MKNKLNLLRFDFPFFFIGKEGRSYFKELTYDTKDMNRFEKNVINIFKNSFRLNEAVDSRKRKHL